MKSEFKGYIFILAVAICFAACTSPPVPTGDRLVSVSWVNPNPLGIHSLETKIGNSPQTVFLEYLPPYSELVTETDQPLYEHSRILTHIMVGKEKIALETVPLGPPLRKSRDGNYNLRIHIHPGLVPSVTLEPESLTRARLSVEEN